MPVRRELSLAEARHIIDTVVAALEERSAEAAVAVTDSHGELIAFARTDDCLLAPINNAIHKAFTASRERVESAVVGSRSREEEFPMTNFGDLRYIAWGGGVPVFVDGEVVGAVGVSGLPEAVDIELARLGAAVVPSSGV